MNPMEIADTIIRAVVKDGLLDENTTLKWKLARLHALIVNALFLRSLEEED